MNAKSFLIMAIGVGVTGVIIGGYTLYMYITDLNP